MSSQYGYNLDTISNAIWFSYQSNTWQQCWYDDSLSLSIKYQFAKQNNLRGIGIWALGYDNNSNELWGGISDSFSIHENGDLNYDDVINISDVIILVNIILEIEPPNTNADLNNDQQINILDILLIINIILNN